MKYFSPIAFTRAAIISLGCAAFLSFPRLQAEEAPVQPSTEDLAFFESKVRPVLAGKCYECHSAAAQEKGKLKAGLYVDSREGLMAGGDSGPALLPGNPQESLLIKVLRHEIKDAEMPPKGKLDDSAIADLAKWIEMGAPDPRVAAVLVAGTRRIIDPSEGRKWWAFQPLVQPPVPDVKNKSLVRTPVDAFIVAKQEAAGLVANAAASPEKLLRRATFGLAGLAPTMEEREAFLKDSSPDAFARLIDRLLGSPRYGERWGRHWLDVVRFAESGGYEFDVFRPGAYHYRDWVIRAFNADMPFDEFVRMQLAGDKLKPDEFDGAAAVGFLVAGPYPGQTTVKTEEKIRYDQLDDMVSTIGSGMLGVTMACARCHDHKHDPLFQRDYYGIAAALATTVHDAAKRNSSGAETQRALEQHKQASVPLAAELKKYETEEFSRRFAEWQKTSLPQFSAATPWQIVDVRSVSAKSAILVSDAEGQVHYAGNKTNDDLYTVKAVTFQKGVRAFRLDALSDSSLPAKGPGLSDNGNFVLADLKIIARPLDTKNNAPPVPVKLKPVAATFEQADYPLASSLDANDTSGWAVAPEMGKDHAAVFAVDGATVGFDGGTEFEFQLRFTGHFGLGRMGLAFCNGAEEAKLGDAKELQHLREIQTLAAVSDGLTLEANRLGLLRWFSHFDAHTKALLDAVSQHERKRPVPEPTEIYTTRDGGRDVHFLRRGEVDRKEGRMSPGFIQVLMPSGDAEKRWTTAAELEKPAPHPRVSLANWMTDLEAGAGSLLARVMVNRVWRQHFGRGLVPSSNDFGSQGAKPANPALLDWLALELMRNGWHLKPIHRVIMSSAVYMQSGEVNPANVRADPDNDLWSQRPARRLEAEAIRDELLQIGGKLDEKMFGPSEANYESGRRSVYLRVKRSELIPFLTMFDAPEPAQSVGDRGTTTVPTQALASINSNFMWDIAGRLADRVQATQPASIEVAIARTYELVLCRQPTDSEIQRMKTFIDEQTRLLGNKPDSPAQAMREFCLAMLCLNEFIYVD